MHFTQAPHSVSHSASAFLRATECTAHGRPQPQAHPQPGKLAQNRQPCQGKRVSTPTSSTVSNWLPHPANFDGKGQASHLPSLRAAYMTASGNPYMLSCRFRIHRVCPIFPLTYFSKYTPVQVINGNKFVSTELEPYIRCFNCSVHGRQNHGSPMSLADTTRKHPLRQAGECVYVACMHARMCLCVSFCTRECVCHSPEHSVQNCSVARNPVQVDRQEPATSRPPRLQRVTTTNKRRNPTPKPSPPSRQTGDTIKATGVQIHVPSTAACHLPFFLRTGSLSTRNSQPLPLRPPRTPQRNPAPSSQTCGKVEVRTLRMY